MSGDARPSALRRKLRGPPRTETPADDGLRAWRLALARALSETASLPARVRGIARDEVAPDAFEALPGEGDLILLLEAGSGRFGLALVDAALLTSVIEAQTMGRVMPRPVPERAPTGTDAAMVADALDRMLVLAERDVPGAECTGFRYATRLQGGPAIVLALADDAHSLMDVTFDLGNGAREGRLRLLFPPVPAPEVETPDKPHAAPWAERLEKAVMGGEVTVDGRLGRLRLTAEEVMALRPGATLPFDRKDLYRVRLITRDGTTAALAQLGRSGGYRALRLLPREEAEAAPDWDAAPEPPPLPSEE